MPTYSVSVIGRNVATGAGRCPSPRWPRRLRRLRNLPLGPSPPHASNPFHVVALRPYGLPRCTIRDDFQASPALELMRAGTRSARRAPLFTQTNRLLPASIVSDVSGALESHGFSSRIFSTRQPDRPNAQNSLLIPCSDIRKLPSSSHIAHITPRYPCWCGRRADPLWGLGSAPEIAPYCGNQQRS